jgi:hypothetical protein
VIGRRAVLLAGAAAVMPPAPSALPVPLSDMLAFRLIRHGSEIGRHVVTFDRRGDTLTVHVAVEAHVTVLSIPFVHYTHRATETWRSGALVGLDADTDKNGRRGWVRAHESAEGLMVEGSQAACYVAPPNAVATSYWNKRMLDGPMISLEDGVLLHPKVALEPPDTIPLASGAVIPAEHYSLTGPFSAEVWYDRGGIWAGLAVGVSDGSSVRYERL